MIRAIAVLAIATASMSCTKESPPSPSAGQPATGRLVAAPPSDAGRVDGAAIAEGTAEASVTAGMSIVSDTPVEVDDRVLGHVIVAASNSAKEIVWTDAQYSRLSLMRMRGASAFEISGVVDLAWAGSIPTGSTGARLRTNDMKIPVLVARVTVEEEKSTDQMLLFIGARDLRTYFFERVSTRYSDGFGGYDIGGLRIVIADDGIRLEGTRQDRLPERRARCLKPKPYPVAYELRDKRFRRLPPKLKPSAPCR